MRLSAFIPYLAALNAGDQVSLAAARMIRSGASMQALLDDLVDFNRTNLGLHIKIAPSDTDLATMVDDELEQLRGAHPNRRLEVTNSGPPIDPSTLSQIFDPLQRGLSHADGQGARESLGLGLFIVREIARAHGGEVEVWSDEGETTFSVRLPRKA